MLRKLGRFIGLLLTFASGRFPIAPAAGLGVGTDPP